MPSWGVGQHIKGAEMLRLRQPPAQKVGVGRIPTSHPSQSPTINGMGPMSSQRRSSDDDAVVRRAFQNGMGEGPAAVRDTLKTIRTAGTLYASCFVLVKSRRGRHDGRHRSPSWGPDACHRPEKLTEHDGDRAKNEGKDGTCSALVDALINKLNNKRGLGEASIANMKGRTTEAGGAKRPRYA
jgi:hypothetical protein